MRPGTGTATEISQTYYLHNPGSYVTQSSASQAYGIDRPGWVGSYYDGKGALPTSGFVTAPASDGYGLPLPGGTPCFAAGTQVLVGYDSNGKAITKNIEGRPKRGSG